MGYARAYIPGLKSGALRAGWVKKAVYRVIGADGEQPTGSVVFAGVIDGVAWNLNREVSVSDFGLARQARSGC
jgi:hypothetical protein